MRLTQLIRQQLVNQFHNLGYFNLKDRYDDVEITDQPTVETSISIDGTVKSVQNYLGTIKLPELEKLRQLENMIDGVANSSQWVGLQGSNSTLTSSQLYVLIKQPKSRQRPSIGPDLKNFIISSFHHFITLTDLFRWQLRVTRAFLTLS